MLHQERLKVQRLLGFVKMSDLEMTSTMCSAFTIPESHQSKGVYGYDVVFYVSAAPTSENIMAVADACYKMSNGRPVFAALDVPAGRIEYSHNAVRELAHEMAHALGFSLGVFTSKGMTKTVADVRGKPTTLEVVSAKAVKAAQEHFGDSSLTGVELEDPLWDVHWNGRNLKDELMASNPEVGAYTAITLDCSRTLGTTRRTTARRRRWLGGYQAGPEFLTKKCVIDGVSQFPQMFCTDESTAERCTEGHLTMGFCNLMTRSEDLPSYFQYFSDPKKGGAQDYAESCPFIQGFYKSDCRYSNDMPGGLVTPTSRCMQTPSTSEELKIANQADGVSLYTTCAAVQCGTSTYAVKFSGASEWVPCPVGVDGAAVQVQLDVCEWHPDVPALCCDVRCYG
eukprot:gene12269-biopygen8577